MSRESNQSGTLQSSTIGNQTTARNQEILRSATVLTGWGAVVTLLTVGSLVSYMGWIPDRLTQSDGILRTHGLWPYMAIALGLGFLVRLFRLRALVRTDTHSQRLADISGFVVDSLLSLAFIVGLISFFAVILSASVKPFALSATISALVAITIGVAVVCGSYGLSVLAHRRGWSLIAPDSGLDPVIGGTLALVIALPVAWLFGFMACILTIALLDASGYQVEALKAYFSDNTLIFPTAAFLALTVILHAGCRALWRGPSAGPNFLGTMMLTGVAVLMALIVNVVSN